jgi:hypothetical protein
VATGLPRRRVVIPTSGSVSSGTVTWARPGGRFPLRTLPPRAQVWAVAEDNISLGVACLISYWLTTRVLSLVYSVSADDNALGGMWAVIAAVFVVRTATPRAWPRRCRGSNALSAARRI